MRLVKPSFEIMASSIETKVPLRYSYANVNKLIEAAGRTCYKTEDKITETSADAFVEMLRKRKHAAMLEHSWGVVALPDIVGKRYWAGPRSPFLRYSLLYHESNIDIPNKSRRTMLLLIAGNMRAFEEEYPDMWQRRRVEFKTADHDPNLLHAVTVRIICDRGVTHEIVRHRPPAYAQESTRYCNYEGGVTFVIPPWTGLMPGEVNVGHIFGKRQISMLPQERWICAMANAEEDYIQLLKDGWSPQEARSVLPNSTKTEIVITTNVLEWKWIFGLRVAKAAHPQMREVMIPLEKKFCEIFPKNFK